MRSPYIDDHEPSGVSDPLVFLGSGRPFEFFGEESKMWPMVQCRSVVQTDNELHPVFCHCKRPTALQLLLHCFFGTRPVVGGEGPRRFPKTRNISATKCKTDSRCPWMSGRESFHQMVSTGWVFNGVSPNSRIKLIYTYILGLEHDGTKTIRNYLLEKWGTDCHASPRN